MPKLVRLYIESIVVGFALAGAFTAGLLWWDIAGLGRLVLGSDIGFIAAGMLVVFNGIVFAAVQFAVRVMGMAEDEAPRGGHGALIPVPVRAETRRP